MRSYNDQERENEELCNRILVERGWYQALFPECTIELKPATKQEDREHKVDYHLHAYINKRAPVVFNIQAHFRKPEDYSKWRDVCITAHTNKVLCEFYETRAGILVYGWRTNPITGMVDVVMTYVDPIRYLLTTEQVPRTLRKHGGKDQWFYPVSLGELEKRGLIHRPKGFRW